MYPQCGDWPDRRDNAAQFETLFHAKGIDNRCFYLDGLTRINTKVVDASTGDTTDINMPGPTLEPEAIEALIVRLLARMDGPARAAGWWPPAACRRSGPPTPTHG